MELPNPGLISVTLTKFWGGNLNEGHIPSFPHRVRLKVAVKILNFEIVLFEIVYK